MQDMKGDMGGSAAVVGAMVSIAKRKAKANVIGLVGLVENMPDGNAQRPGDIVKAAAGKTIEIQNTDAEGRLVLWRRSLVRAEEVQSEGDGRSGHADRRDHHLAGQTSMPACSRTATSFRPS